jgi:hypothetical protein
LFYFFISLYKKQQSIFFIPNKINEKIKTNKKHKNQKNKIKKTLKKISFSEEEKKIVEA